MPDTAPQEKQQPSFVPDFTEEQAKYIVGQVRRRFELSLKAQSKQRKRWRRNEELVGGDHFARFSNLDKTKSRIVLNMVFEVIETIMPYLTDMLPKPEVLPEPTEVKDDALKPMMESAQKMEDAIDHQWRESEMPELWVMALKSSLIYGNAPIRMLPAGDNPFLQVDLIDVFSWFLTPGCTDFRKSAWIATVTPVYLMDLVRTYGYEATKKVKSEGKLDNYRSFNLIPPTKDDSTATSMRNDSIGASGTSDFTTVDDGEGHARRDELGQVLLIDMWLDHDLNPDAEDAVSEEGGQDPPAPQDTYLHVTVAGSEILVHEQTEYPIGDPPFTDIKNYPYPNSPWGTGEPDNIETLNIAADVILSESVDTAVLHNNPPIVATEDMKKSNPGGIKVAPGKTIWIRTRASSVEWFKAWQMPNWIQALPMMLQEFVNTISGVTDVTQGRKPGQVTAASAISKLQEAAQSRVRHKEKLSLRGPLIDVYRHFGEHVRSRVEQQIFLKKDRTSGDFKASSYGMEDFKGMKFKYRAGIPILDNKVDLINLMVELAPLLQLSPDVMLEMLPAEIRDPIMAAMNRKEQQQGPLAGLDQEQMTEEEQAILQSGDQEAIGALLSQMAREGRYTPPQARQEFDPAMTAGPVKA